MLMNSHWGAAQGRCMALYMLRHMLRASFPARSVDFADLWRLPQGLVTEVRWSEGESRAPAWVPGRTRLVCSAWRHILASLAKASPETMGDSR